MPQRLLLISSSRTHGTEFLEHCKDPIRRHLEGIRSVLFIPFALADHDGYASIASAPFRELGIELNSIHESAQPADAIQHAEAIFIGGGNSFRLLKTLYEHSLVDPIRDRVGKGCRYIGSSAGTNMACPTIRTSNDMPIVEPPSLDALGLIPFQINPHFIDADPNSTHQGETREQRLSEYLEENTVPVLGLREGSWLEVDGKNYKLGGGKSAICMRQGTTPFEIPVGSQFTDDFDGQVAMG